MEACTNPYWRLVWVFCRYAGLRLRSEFPTLKWKDIDWEHNAIFVWEKKKKKYRRTPMFPELREALCEAWDLTEPGEEYIWTFAVRLYNIVPLDPDRWNPTTTLTKTILRAGLEPWGKLIQNCRSTRETELCARYPIQDVTKWIGNTPGVALKHYLQPTDDVFQRAVMTRTGKSPHKIDYEKPFETVK